jgi:hypothetical protein
MRCNMIVKQTPTSGFDCDPRICLFSLRNIKQHVSRCHPYEFEDVICGIDSVSLMAPSLLNNQQSIGQRFWGLARRLIMEKHHGRLVEKARLKQDFAVFFMICQNISDLEWLGAIEGWKDHCQLSVCWLEEVWVTDEPSIQKYSKILNKFDYTIVNCSESVDVVKKYIDNTCHLEPTGINAIRFCPYPNPQPRSVDVYSYGRRSECMHQALRKSKEIFYIYDTIKDMYVYNHRQHRDLVSNILKRSKFFLVNPAKFDDLTCTQGHHETGYRYFEGAASGAVMLGRSPQSETFRQHFDWPDAVVEAPDEEELIGAFLLDLNSQPKRLAAIRRNGVVQSLRRHDWAHRWRTILDVIGLEPLAALLEREKILCDLANILSECAFSDPLGQVEHFVNPNVAKAGGSQSQGAKGQS